MVESKVIKAGLYIRVSTDRQAEAGYSVEAQKENLTNFANEQGWNIFDLYADEGISGKNIQDRPDVKRLINDIKNKKIDVVVLYKFDRLTRDMSDTEDVMKLIQEFGIQVYTISGGTVDVSTATGRFQLRISGAVAQLEREQIIERVKAALVQKVKSGKSLCTSIISYGYDRPKHQEIQTINKEEARIVKRIFKMYITGKTFTEIAKLLNAEGIPTKNKGKVRKRRNSNETYVINSVWQPKTIRLILSNITYIGGVRYGINTPNEFEELNGLHEPIISQEMWDKVQERLTKVKTVSRTNYPKEDVYYCGTLICAVCGHKLTTQRTKKTAKDGTKLVHCAYRCINREKGQCTAIGMSHNKVEEVFLNYIENIEELSEIENIDTVEEDENIIEHIMQLKNKQSETERKKKEVMDLFMRNDIDYNQMSYMTSELEKNFTILKKELTRLEKQYQPTKQIDKSLIAKTIKEHWKYLSDKERLEFLTRFVEKIVIVNRDTNRVSGRPEIIEVKFYQN
ncbi:MAG: recombinase family protein [Bacilli bacterium]|nr:recombinase family protein [Bacilli bacterium]MDD4795788.1 recombinase family protein [Bacilli bacterium]